MPHNQKIFLLPLPDQVHPTREDEVTIERLTATRQSNEKTTMNIVRLWILLTTAAVSVVECFQPSLSASSRIGSPCLEKKMHFPRRTTTTPLFADGGDMPKDDSSGSEEGEITDLDKAFSEITQEPIKKTPAEAASSDGPKIDTFTM